MHIKRLLRRFYLEERIRNAPLLLRDRSVRLLQEVVKLLSASRRRAPSRCKVVIRVVRVHRRRSKVCIEPGWRNEERLIIWC